MPFGNATEEAVGSRLEIEKATIGSAQGRIWDVYYSILQPAVTRWNLSVSVGYRAAPDSEANKCGLSVVT